MLWAALLGGWVAMRWRMHLPATAFGECGSAVLLGKRGAVRRSMQGSWAALFGGDAAVQWAVMLGGGPPCDGGGTRCPPRLGEFGNTVLLGKRWRFEG